MAQQIRDKAIITCALTGVLADRKQCPAIPYTPVEIAEEAERAYNAGAAIVHIHARNDDGSASYDPAVFVQIRDEIRQRCPVILNFSTGSLDQNTTLPEQMIAQAQPEIAALNMGSMNYAKYSERQKAFVFEMLFPNRFSKIEKLLRAMNKNTVKPELECFDSGHTKSAEPFLAMELLKTPLQFSFIVDVLGGMPATVESLQLQKNLIPQGSQWEVIGISWCQWRMVATALVLGGNIRVGLEDHFYLPNGDMASGNGPLVEEAATLTRTLSREPATVAEARQILGLKPAC